ncbi:putative HDOD domain-containing protein [Gammaproteobacteria bacterium]
MKTIPDFDEDTTTKLLKGIVIPSQPSILQNAMAEKQQEYPDLRKIAAIVSKDVALSAAMLRAANSPAFALRNKVSSIPTAVMLLGTRNVMSIITGLSLRMTLSKGGMKLEHFWEITSDTAVVCSVLAQKFHVMNPDQAYMLGLFHDCGIPLMMQHFKDYSEVLQKESVDTEASITEIEDRCFNTNHAVIGYLIARSWGLPDKIRETILFHHDDEELFADHDTTQLSKQIGLLIISEYLSELFHSASINDAWTRVGGDVMRIYNLSEGDVHDLSEDISDMLSNL